MRKRQEWDKIPQQGKAIQRIFQIAKSESKDLFEGVSTYQSNYKDTESTSKEFEKDTFSKSNLKCEDIEEDDMEITLKPQMEENIIRRKNSYTLVGKNCGVPLRSLRVPQSSSQVLRSIQQKIYETTQTNKYSSISLSINNNNNNFEQQQQTTFFNHLAIKKATRRLSNYKNIQTPLSEQGQKQESILHNKFSDFEVGSPFKVEKQNDQQMNNNHEEDQVEEDKKTIFFSNPFIQQSVSTAKKRISSCSESQGRFFTGEEGSRINNLMSNYNKKDSETMFEDEKIVNKGISRKEPKKESCHIKKTLKYLISPSSQSQKNFDNSSAKQKEEKIKYESTKSKIDQQLEEEYFRSLSQYPSAENKTTQCFYPNEKRKGRFITQADNTQQTFLHQENDINNYASIKNTFTQHSQVEQEYLQNTNVNNPTSFQNNFDECQEISSKPFSKQSNQIGQQKKIVAYKLNSSHVFFLPHSKLFYKKDPKNKQQSCKHISSTTNKIAGDIEQQSQQQQEQQQQQQEQPQIKNDYSRRSSLHKKSLSNHNSLSQLPTQETSLQEMNSLIKFQSQQQLIRLKEIERQELKTTQEKRHKIVSLSKYYVLQGGSMNNDPILNPSRSYKTQNQLQKSNDQLQKERHILNLSAFANQKNYFNLINPHIQQSHTIQNLMPSPNLQLVGSPHQFEQIKN